ncbi:MAG: alpha/beta hydrolase [Pseudomonadota bacterium]
MYVITNREVTKRKARDLKQFGDKPNKLGNNELRVARVTRKNGKWDAFVLPDSVTPAMAARLIKENKLCLDPKDDHYASLRVACEVVNKARKEKRHILFFVHGYNNNFEDTIERAWDFEQRYGVVCLVFSWPANGGGVKGVASYKSDKRDARASTGALERALMIMYKYLELVSEDLRKRLYQRAEKKWPENGLERDREYVALLEKHCPYTVNAIFHSMGNYLLKHMLKSSINEGNRLMFDNIVLAAPDTNNLDHDLWVEKLQFRNRCFVAINENDFALGFSRLKGGNDQLARLGHYLKGLDAKNAHYINFTDADHVGKSHGVFGKPATQNNDIFEFFKSAFSGQPAEETLTYKDSGNYYEF